MLPVFGTSSSSDCSKRHLHDYDKHPKVVDKHIRMNLGKELSNITTGFETVKASAFSQLPIIISECDPMPKFGKI